MSSIGNIKQQVNQIGQSATSAAAQLVSLAQKLEQNSAAITQAIGDTSTGEDKSISTSFLQASKAVKDAANALQAAAQAANKWVSKA